MKHKHHIIPKHMGGSDDPSNLIELTIEEHAEAHRILYEQYGKIQDYYAWQGLKRTIGKEDILKGIMNSEQMRKHLSKKAKEYWENLSEEERKIKKEKFLQIRKLTKGSTGKTWKLSDETKLKLSKPKSENHRKNISKGLKGTRTNEKNPSFGTIWITNEIESLKIKNDDIIPDGWRQGRAFKPRKKRLI